MNNIYLDIETKSSKDEVGGWYPEKMGLAVAVTYDKNTGFKEWIEKDVVELINYLLSFDKIIGFNTNGFDFFVLNGYQKNVYTLLLNKSFDMLDYIYKKIGFRIKLDDLVYHTLGKNKSGDGLQSIQWYKEGKIDKVIDYCKNDVLVTKELYEFGLQNGKIFYPSFGNKKTIFTDWK